MLTIHTAPLLLPVGTAPVEDGAVAVAGDRIAAFGPYDDVAAAAPGARV
ncbi:imidazolonepropionase-like domain-containing protein, partial [Streptomyces sp. S6]